MKNNEITKKKALLWLGPPKRGTAIILKTLDFKANKFGWDFPS